MALVASLPPAASDLRMLDDDDSLSVECKNINVFFQFVDGKTFCLWLDPNMDVQSVKVRLLEHRKLTGQTPAGAWFLPNDIFFCWNGRPLDEDLLLVDYGVKDSATIAVSYRNRGGCFMVSLSVLTIICAAVIGSPCTCGFSLFIVPLLLPLLFVLPLFCL